MKTSCTLHSRLWWLIEKPLPLTHLAPKYSLSPELLFPHSSRSFIDYLLEAIAIEMQSVTRLLESLRERVFLENTHLLYGFDTLPISWNEQSANLSKAHSKCTPEEVRPMNLYRRTSKEKRKLRITTYSICFLRFQNTNLPPESRSTLKPTVQSYRANQEEKTFSTLCRCLDSHLVEFN